MCADVDLEQSFLLAADFELVLEILGAEAPQSPVESGRSLRAIQHFPSEDERPEVYCCLSRPSRNHGPLIPSDLEDLSPFFAVYQSIGQEKERAPHHLS